MPSLRTTLRTTLRKAVPPRHRLGYDLMLDRVTRRAEPELVHLSRITRGGEVAVDVGANQGFYSYVLAAAFRRVLAFEPNAAVAADLERCGMTNVEVHKVALSAADGSGELFVPRVNGVEQHGWASFDPHNLPDATSVAPLRVPVRALDGYGLDGVEFIKIDVEGHEPATLAGAVRTISRNRPVVLVEVRERNRDEVIDFFDAFDYQPYRVREGRLVPWSPDAACDGENFVFRPRSRRPARRSFLS